MFDEELTGELSRNVSGALETPERFRAWLERRPTTYVAGLSMCSGKCPVAVYLNSTCLTPAASERGLRLAAFIDAMGIFDTETLDTRKLAAPPAWARSFMELVDDLGYRHAVSRETALSLLEIAAKGVG